jgi:hypothetical protein
MEPPPPVRRGCGLDASRGRVAVLVVCLLLTASRVALFASVGAARLADRLGLLDLRPIGMTAPMILTASAALACDLSVAQAVAVCAVQATYTIFSYSDEGSNAAEAAAAAQGAALSAARPGAAQGSGTGSCSPMSGSAVQAVCASALGLSPGDMLFLDARGHAQLNASADDAHDFLSANSLAGLARIFTGITDAGLALNVDDCLLVFTQLTCGIGLAGECRAGCSRRALCGSTLCPWLNKKCPLLPILGLMLGETRSYELIMSPAEVALFTQFLKTFGSLCDATGGSIDSDSNADSGSDRCYDFYLPGTWAERRASEPEGACTRASIEEAALVQHEAGLTAAAAVDKRRLVAEAASAAVFTALFLWLLLFSAPSRRARPTQSQQRFRLPNAAGCALLVVPLLCSASASALSLFAARDASSSILGVLLSVSQAQVLIYRILVRLAGWRREEAALGKEASVLTLIMHHSRAGGSLYWVSKTMLDSVCLLLQLRDVGTYVSRRSDVLLVDLLCLYLSLSLVLQPQLLRIARHDWLLAWDICGSAAYLLIYLNVLYEQISAGSRSIGLGAVITLNLSIALLGGSALLLFDYNQQSSRRASWIVGHRVDRNISLLMSIRHRGLRSVLVAPLNEDGSHGGSIRDELRRQQEQQHHQHQQHQQQQQQNRPETVLGVAAVAVPVGVFLKRREQERKRRKVQRRLSACVSYLVSLGGLAAGMGYFSVSLAGQATCREAFSECIWSGVRPRVLFPDGPFAPTVCDLSFVSAVNARGCGLRELPAATRALAGASSFDLRGNPLRDVPAWLARRAIDPGVAMLVDGLDGIEHLDWSGAQLRAVPVALLGQTPRLSTLNLSDNELEQLPGAELRALLPELRQLDLSRNRLEALDDETIRMLIMPGIDVRVDDNPVKKVHISTKHVGPQGIELPSTLGHLDALEELVITDTNYNGEFPGWISQLTHLRRLNVQSNRMVGTFVMASIAPLAHLEHLSILYERTLDIDLGTVMPALPALKAVDIAFTGGRSNVVPSFAAVPNLVSLLLRASGLRGAVDFDQIKRDLPNLKILDFSHGELQCTLAPALLSASSLWFIALENNNCSGPLPEAPPGTAARLITLSHNHFSGPCPPSWARNMRGVIRIALEGNDLEGPIPAEWGHMDWASAPNLTVDERVREPTPR